MTTETREITSNMVAAGINLFGFYMGYEWLFPKYPHPHPYYAQFQRTMSIFQSGIFSFITVALAGTISKTDDPVMGDYLLAIIPVLIIDHLMYLYQK